MATRTTNLASKSITADGTIQDLFQVPAGHTAIVKFVTIWQSGAGTPCRLAVRPDAATGNLFFWGGTPIINIGLQLDFWLVLMPGWVMSARADPGGAVRIGVSGTLLEGVAS